jgi:hypothetical protein
MLYPQNTGFGKIASTTRNSNFAADLLQVQQPVIIYSIGDCSAGQPKAPLAQDR